MLTADGGPSAGKGPEVSTPAAASFHDVWLGPHGSRQIAISSWTQLSCIFHDSHISITANAEKATFAPFLISLSRAPPGPSPVSGVLLWGHDVGHPEAPVLPGLASVRAKIGKLVRQLEKNIH